MGGIPTQGSLDLVCHVHLSVWLDIPNRPIAALYASQSISGSARVACRCLEGGTFCTDRLGGNLDLLAYGDCSALASEIILFPSGRPCRGIKSLIRAAPETWWILCACTAFTNRRRGPLPRFRASHRPLFPNAAFWAEPRVHCKAKSKHYGRIGGDPAGTRKIPPSGPQTTTHRAGIPSRSHYNAAREWYYGR
jgi:hypothetical protein